MPALSTSAANGITSATDYQDYLDEAWTEINLRLITTSPIKVSCLIPRSDIEKAVRALHTAFSLGE